MNVVVVIVTYGDRVDFVKAVVESIDDDSVAKIIIVDNGSSFRSRSGIQEMMDKSPSRFEIVRLDENIGSSGGFKAGISRALEVLPGEFVWLLDDDNKPSSGALKHLLDFWKDYRCKSNSTMLVSHRPDRKRYLEAVERNDPSIVLGSPNSFLLFDILQAVRRIFWTYRKKSSDTLIESEKHGRISAAPYGGMFFHKSMVSQIGLPDDRFFVYTDDTEFSYRLIRKGGSIILVLKSLLEDIDTSWQSKTSNGIFYHPVFNTDLFRVYYTFRNRAYFELNYRVSCRAVYFVNVATYLARLFIISLVARKPRVFLVCCRAVWHGYTSRLGKVTGNEFTHRE